MIVATPHRAIQTNVTMRQLVAKGGLLVRTDANLPAACSRYPKVANSIDRSTSKLHAIRLHPLYPLDAEGWRERERL